MNVPFRAFPPDPRPDLSRRRSPAILTVAAALLFGLVPDPHAAESPASLQDAFRSRFLVGAAVNRGVVTGTGSFFRNTDQVEQDIALTRAQFNQISPENDLKWQIIHPQEGTNGYVFPPADAFVNFGLSNGLYLVGHTLIWHSQTPDWVFAGTNPPPPGMLAPTRPPSGPDARATNAPNRSPSTQRPPGAFGGGFGVYLGPRASREELLARMRDHIHTVVGRYRGKIKAWDVVNEALADGSGTNLLRNSLWLQIIGPDFIAKAFQYAHEADPDAVLRYNDYGLENPAKRRKLVTLIRSLQEQKVPVMAIGSQAHLNLEITSQTMDDTLTDLATLGLPIHITELDINTARAGQRNTGADVSGNAATTQGGLVDEAERRQADAYAGIFRAFVKHADVVKLVTFWGVNDAVSWRRQGRPLLFDGNNQPKPALAEVLRAASVNATPAP